MNILASLIPGLRDVRAPLVGGYLWLLFIWLVAEPSRPRAQSGDLYGRLDEIGQAVGPIGHAIAASVGAYLVGSLLTSIVLFLARRANEWWSTPITPSDSIEAHNRTNEPWLQREHQEDDNAYEVKFGELLYIDGVNPRFELIGRFDKALLRSIQELLDRELGEKQRELQAVLQQIQDENDSAAFWLIERGDTFLARIEVGEPREDGVKFENKEFVIPRFSMKRDLFREFSVLRTRLVEHAETTGTEVERIHAEAEFRFAVAAPLLAIVILFCTSSLLWLPAVLIPLAIAVQGFSLERQSNRQLVDALRARSGTEELGQITPVFTRYRNDAYALTQALLQSRARIPAVAQA